MEALTQWQSLRSRFMDMLPRLSTGITDYKRQGCWKKAVGRAERTGHSGNQGVSYGHPAFSNNAGVHADCC